MASKQETLVDYAKKHGVIRARDLASVGVSRSVLRSLVDSGTLVRVGRGLYSLRDYSFTEAHTIVEAVRTQSKGVVCLSSALSFHGIGTQQPHEVWLAIPYGARVAVRGSVPIRVVVMKNPAYLAGIETHKLEGIDVSIYSVAKTVADCFKFRNKIGHDVAVEALREVLNSKRSTRDDIYRYAKINRVEAVIRPYLEALSQ